MEYCSPLWAGFPASYLSQLDAVETKAFKIIGITSTEVDSMGLSIFHRRQVSGLCFLPPPLGSCTLCTFCALFHPQFSAGRTRSTIKSFLVNLPKSRIMAHLHSLVPYLAHLWNKLPHSLQSQSSLQIFKTAFPSHLRSSPIQNHDLFHLF